MLEIGPEQLIAVAEREHIRPSLLLPRSGGLPSSIAGLAAVLKSRRYRNNSLSPIDNPRSVKSVLMNGNDCSGSFNDDAPELPLQCDECHCIATKIHRIHRGGDSAIPAMPDCSNAGCVRAAGILAGYPYLKRMPSASAANRKHLVCDAIEPESRLG